MNNNTTLSATQRFFRLIKGDRKEIYYIYLYAIFAGLINLILPLGIQAILNLIQGGAISSSWWLLIFVVTAGTLFAGLLVIMQLTVSETLQRRIFTRVSFDFAERIPNLRTESIRREYVPELVNRFFDTLTIQKGLPKVLIDLSTSVMQILFGLILLSFYHPFFIFFGFVLILILVIIFRFTSPTGLKTSIIESKYKYEVAYWLQEIGRTLSTFKLTGSNELPLSKTDYFVKNYLDAKEKHFNILKIQYISIISFKTLITFVLLALGSFLVINNQINLGQFVAAELIILLVINSVEKLILTMETVYDVLTAIDKIGAVSDIPLDSTDGVDFQEVNTGQGIRVQLQDVSLQYQDSKFPTLENINLDIKAGEKVCIAGYNGSGKTSLVQIISCYLNDFQGNVLYNGIPRRNFNQKSLRNFIGDFSIQEDIFKGTLRENIDLGNPKTSFQHVVHIAEQVGLNDLVKSLPKGFDTMLFPEGKNLPRNAKAKIILARGLASQPQLLAVEEIMANIELRDRQHIAKLLTDRNNPWTLVVVTDDPILASQCDRIFIMNEGRIIDEGNFESVKQSPHFNKVFKVYNINE